MGKIQNISENEIANNMTSSEYIGLDGKIHHKFDVTSSDKFINALNNKIINLFIVGTDSVKFTFKNSNVFYNVVLPELIRLYIDNIDSIIKKEHIKQFNTSFVNINDNFYLLGLKEDIVVSSLKYIDDILNIKKYQIDLNKEFMVDYTEDEVNINYNKRVYSYGYANILLISFIISVITILLCFFKG